MASRRRKSVMASISFMSLVVLHTKVQENPVQEVCQLPISGRRPRSCPIQGRLDPTRPLTPLHGVNTARRPQAARWAAAIVALAIAAVLGLPESRTFAQPPTQPTLAPPAPDRAIVAFNQVEPWVRAGSVPQNAEALAVPGASVILRLDGALIGRGTSAEPDALRTAAARAIDEAALRLSPQRDALQAEQARESWKRITISLELSGALVPFTPATFDDVDGELSPGLEGVGARAGSRVELVFPGTMLVRNTTPGEALASAISRACDDPTLAIRNTPAGEPGAIALARAVTFYRFRAVHLAQSDPARTPIFLERGGKLVLPSSLNTASLRAWADGMAANLLDRCSDGPAVRGTYWPATGRSEPAGVIEQVLVARALDRYSQTPGCAPDLGKRARQVSGRVLDALGQRPVGADGPDSSPASGALWGVALSQSEFGAITDWLVPRGRMWRACLDILDTAAKDISIVPEGQRAVVAFALVRRADGNWPGDPADAASREALRATARRALDAVYAATPPGNLVGQMPWLGWADEYLSGDTIAGAAALREVREQVYAHTLTPETAGPGNDDLAGGVVFTSSRTPAPTWQTVRPAAFLASALGDQRLTGPAEVMKEISRLLPVLRFLRQLTADENTAWMCQDPDAARWGVRGAPWDQRQNPEATAMTLVTVCETLRSLDEIGRRAGPNGKEQMSK